jgi:hypothetical protein
MPFTLAESVVSHNGAGTGNRVEDVKMNVEEALARINQMPMDSVLVTKPPLAWGSEAMFVRLTDDGRVAESVKEAGYEYLLGREEIMNLLDFLKKKRVSSRTVAEFIINCAINDSPPSWINDIPDI